MDIGQEIYRLPSYRFRKDLKEYLSNICGAPLVNFHMETLRICFQNPYESGLERSSSLYLWHAKGIPSKIYRKAVWGAIGQFPYGNLKECLSKSMG